MQAGPVESVRDLSMNPWGDALGHYLDIRMVVWILPELQCHDLP